MSSAALPELKGVSVPPVPRGRKPSQYKGNPKCGPVDVVRFTEGGVECVRVPLWGRGYRRFMELWATDWDDGRENQDWPSCWVLVGDPDNLGYVGTGRQPVCRLARQPGGGDQVAIMARLITGARPGDVVEYCDRNPLNLRRSNLHKLDRVAAGKRTSELRAAGVIC